MNKAPYIRAKDYDHEDVDAEFKAEETLGLLANVLASFAMFTLLMLSITLAMQFPESWFSWVVLVIGGV